MSRWLGLAVVALLLIVAAVGFFQPQMFPAGFDAPRLAYLLMALLLATGAGWGFWRIRMEPRAALAGVVFWAALIVVLVMVYSWFN
jgi:hypothetical protein